MSTISRFRFKTRAGADFEARRGVWRVAGRSVGAGLVAEGQRGRGEAVALFWGEIERGEVAGPDGHGGRKGVAGFG